MRIFKLIAVLLDYPAEDLGSHADEIRMLIEGETCLRADAHTALSDFVARLQTSPPMDWQAEYVATFDRGRALSLHLFEHVHGESRDRGQAMVDLLARYRARGLEIAAAQLPDYLPLFLEYCALLPEHEARDQLAETGHILQLLHTRLSERGSPYAMLFLSLLHLSGVGLASDALRATVAEEARDDTPEALDRVWAEAPVTFGVEAEPEVGRGSTIRWVEPPRGAGISR